MRAHKKRADKQIDRTIKKQKKEKLNASNSSEIDIIVVFPFFFHWRCHRISFITDYYAGVWGQLLSLCLSCIDKKQETIPSLPQIHVYLIWILNLQTKKKRRKMKQFLTNELITIFLISIFTHTGAHTQTGPIIVGIPLECITPKTTWIRIVVAAAAQPSCHQQLQSASQHRAKQHLLFAKQSTIKLLIKVPRKRICR